jgi:TRAP-type C4-dicarboxylate transport system substrate-binding protein
MRAPDTISKSDRMRASTAGEDGGGEIAGCSREETMRYVRHMLAAAFAASAALVPHTASAEVTLKAVTAWGKNFTFVEMYMEWIKRVNEKGKGKIRIDYVGGPEVYPSFEQLEPLKRGVFATMITSTAYIAGALPETNATWFGFGATPAQLREAGLVAAIDKITREKAGVMLLGMPLQMKFNVYTKKEIKGANLSGLKMRTTPIYDPVLKGLGASTLTVPPTELLTALESGIVDGFAWPGVAVTGPGYARAIKYRVTPSWWVGTDIALMNAKAYDSLPADVQKLLVDTMIDIEKETPAFFGAKEKAEEAAMDKAGIQTIAMSDADMTKIRKIHWEAGVEAFLMKPSPKYGPELKKILERFAPK